MIMRAKQEGNVLIFELEGHLDFETTQQFKETCANLMKQASTTRVVINFNKLKFVGSTGINQFVEILKQFNGRKERPKMCHVSSEFQKILKAYQTSRSPFEIFDGESAAIASFEEPKVKKISKKVEIEN